MSDHDSGYSLGIADGHRLAAQWADEALPEITAALAEPELRQVLYTDGSYSRELEEIPISVSEFARLHARDIEDGLERLTDDGKEDYLTKHLVKLFKTIQERGKE